MQVRKRKERGIKRYRYKERERQTDIMRRIGNRESVRGFVCVCLHIGVSVYCFEIILN